MTDVAIKPGPGIKELVRELKETPDRLDKEMRKEFRDTSRVIRDDARDRAEAARPRPKGEPRPRAKKSYHWKNLVNAITNGADSIGPFVKYGAEKIPGWPGHEWGSDTYPQFQPRTPKIGRGNAGHFFSPAVREGIPKAAETVEAIVLKYTEVAFGKL